MTKHRSKGGIAPLILTRTYTVDTEGPESVRVVLTIERIVYELDVNSPEGEPCPMIEVPLEPCLLDFDWAARQYIERHMPQIMEEHNDRHSATATA